MESRGNGNGYRDMFCYRHMALEHNLAPLTRVSKMCSLARTHQQTHAHMHTRAKLREYGERKALAREMDRAGETRREGERGMGAGQSAIISYMSLYYITCVCVCVCVSQHIYACINVITCSLTNQLTTCSMCFAP